MLTIQDTAIKLKVPESKIHPHLLKIETTTMYGAFYITDTGIEQLKGLLNGKAN